LAEPLPGGRKVDPLDHPSLPFDKGSVRQLRRIERARPDRVVAPLDDRVDPGPKGLRDSASLVR